MPDVIRLSKRTAADGVWRPPAAAEVPSGGREDAGSLTPVFNALVREWRAEGRDIPLRHKPAAYAQERDAA